MTTELTTFTGNWANIPDTPVIKGKELTGKSIEHFDRACAFAREIRDYGKQLGIDFNRKYIVEKNGQQRDYIDYDKVAEHDDDNVLVEYPEGGRVGDMVYFHCDIRASFDYHFPASLDPLANTFVGDTIKGVFYGLTKRKPKPPKETKVEFKGLSCYIEMKTISKNGKNPLSNDMEWNLFCNSDDKQDYHLKLKEAFGQFRAQFIDRGNYAIRPMTDDEISQYPNIEEEEKKQGVVSHLVPF